MKKGILLFCVLLLTTTTLHAQSHITLHGHITDSKTKKGVPYTAVAVQGTCVGTQSNNRGEYKLKVAESAKTIVFSAIGYKKQVISVKQLQKNGNVRLEPYALELREVQVTDYVSPRKIIAEAVRRIPENYHIDTTVGTWFYRDWRMLNGELYLFDESVVDMLRYGYLHNVDKRYYHFTDTRREFDDYYKTVKKHRLLIYDSLSVILAAGNMEKAMAPLDYSDNSVFNDIVASPDANYYIAARATKKQKFDPIKEYTDADGVEYWQLRAYGRTSNRKTKAYYTLRIRKDNFAIIDAEFEIDTSTASFDYPQSLSPWSHSKINRKTTKMHYELRNGRYTLTHYSDFKDITYYCHRHYGYELADSIQHRVESHEWIMTDLQPGDTSFLRINPVQSHTRKDLIEAFGASNYDEDFWGHYNTLPLDGEVQDALERFFSNTTNNDSNASDTSNTNNILIANADAKRDKLDTLRIIQDTLALTMSPLPRWQFYRYGGIGGNRLVGDDTATHRCFSQQLAVGTRLNLGGRFSLSADLQYAWMTSPTDDHGRLSTHSLTIPLRLNFDLKKPKATADARLYITVGGWGRFAFLGRLGSNWNILGNDINRWDYGFSIGIGVECFRKFFMEWNSYRSLHNSILTPGMPEMLRHNGAFTIGIMF